MIDIPKHDDWNIYNATVVFHEMNFGKPEKTFSNREMTIKSLLSISGEKQVPSFHASTP